MRELHVIKRCGRPALTGCRAAFAVVLTLGLAWPVPARDVGDAKGVGGAKGIAGAKDVADAKGVAGAKDVSSGLERIISRHNLFITHYDYAVTRNLDIAAEKVGHFIMKPGQVFSLNEILGERTPEKGYKIAPAYAGGGVSVEEFGGGLCMVSTLLYNVFLKAGLEIVERHPHQRPVGYALSGLDATVNWPFKDIKARNNFDFPVAFRIYRMGRSLRVTLHGPREVLPGLEIEIKRTVSKAIIPGNVSDGFRVRTTRAFYRDGALLKEELLSEDTFLPIDQPGSGKRQ